MQNRNPFMQIQTFPLPKQFPGLCTVEITLSRWNRRIISLLFSYGRHMFEILCMIFVVSIFFGPPFLFTVELHVL